MPPRAIMAKHHAKTETFVVNMGLNGAVRARRRKTISTTQVTVFQEFFCIYPYLLPSLYSD
jgi:hypothetical protein